MSKKFEYINWMKKGDSDRSVASNEFVNLNHPDIACYLLQQSLEKYLKAQLIQMEVEPPRTHRIDALLDKISDVTGIDFDASLNASASYISSLEASTRYPGVEYTSSDYAKAITDYDFIATKLDALNFEIPKWDEEFRYMPEEIFPPEGNRDSETRF